MARDDGNQDWPYLEEVVDELPLNTAVLYRTPKARAALSSPSAGSFSDLTARAPAPQPLSAFSALEKGPVNAMISDTVAAPVKSYALRTESDPIRRQTSPNLSRTAIYRRLAAESGTDTVTRATRPTRAKSRFENLDAVAEGRVPVVFDEAAAASLDPQTEAFRPVPPTPESTVLSVGDAVGRLRDAVSHQLTGWWIAGEVSNFSKPYSGHVYFTLKDGDAQIRCVFFAGAQRYHPVDFHDGDRIEVLGEADVYAKSGDLQIRLTNWRPAGYGALYEAYLRLKAKLRAEGLFSRDNVTMPPAFIKRLAVVTSAQAAALQDVLRTLSRRMPWVQVTLVETSVQGEDAPPQIVRALESADRLGVDAVLLVRGGGSFEDLFCFNDERVVRAVRAMRTPVVAGIGHETDETLASLAADIIASTPTAAAEQVGHDSIYWQRQIHDKWERLTTVMTRLLDESDMHLDRLTERLDTVTQHYSRLGQYLSDKERYIHRVIEGRLSQFEDKIAQAQRRVASPTAMLSGKEAQLARALRSLDGAIQQVTAQKSQHFQRAAARLSTSLTQWDQWERALSRESRRLSQVGATLLQRYEVALVQGERNLPGPAQWLSPAAQKLEQLAQTLKAFDPDTVLLKGFTLVRAGGVPVSEAQSLSVGSRIEVQFADGLVEAQVERVTLSEERSTPLPLKE